MILALGFLSQLAVGNLEVAIALAVATMIGLVFWAFASMLAQHPINWEDENEGEGN